MSEKISIDVPHKLGREQAKARLENGFAKAQEKIAGNAVSVDQSWDGDVMKFTAGMMGQSVSGVLTVFDDKVHIDLDLPWLLAKIAGTFTDKLKHQTQILLEKK